jgi:release factor glutamine methyltransferase
MREVRDFEPHSALDEGVDGLDAYRSLLPAATRLLRTGGWLLLEIGGEEHVAPLRDLEDGLIFCGSRPDLNGHIRVLLWRKGEKMA